MFAFFSQKKAINRFVHVVHDKFQNQEEFPLIDNINNNRQHSKIFFLLLRSIKVSECAEHRKMSSPFVAHYTVCFGWEFCSF